MKNEELGKLRADVDAIDRDLVRLFAKRMEVCDKIGEIKAKAGMAIVDSDREREVLECAMAHVGDTDKPAVRAFMCTILEISKNRQGSVNVPLTN